MFKRILIANRGEVGARILRACGEMGVEAVAVCSTADKDSSWLKGADEVVVLGGHRASESYLNMDALIEVAKHTSCGAVHPGWGFLSENPSFAASVEAVGLTFIGPRPHQLAIMADKTRARATFGALGLRGIPGTDEAFRSVDEALNEASRIGYPVLLKAVSGGGGRGMRTAGNGEELKEGFAAATAEAASAFGDGSLYMEKKLLNARHVEFQVMGDGLGGCVVFAERDCSLQRRYQKVVEESPCASISEEQRGLLCRQVVEVIKETKYRGAGTVEFLMDRDGKVWFMEMNGRLQVEHPITEMVSGVDLVQLQLSVAANVPLEFQREVIAPKGHAIECRINAEDPENDFRPSPGVISKFAWAEGEGVRMDTHLAAGDAISPHYDSMLGKLIVFGDSRDEAVSRMKKALQSVTIRGLKTNLDMHTRLMDADLMVSGAYEIHSLESWLAGEYPCQD